VIGRPGRSGRPLALLAALALAACGGPARKVDDGASHERERRPREALAAYQAALGELGDGALEGELAALRLTAVRRAADISYLELGDYAAAVAYYRRLVALAPGSPDARAARATIAEIYRERFRDPVAAVAQYAALAAEGGPGADRAHLQVARLYLELDNAEQARTEARALAERWPDSDAAAQARLVTAQAYAREGRVDDAVATYEAAARAAGGGEVAALALEAAANLLSADGRLARAIELYGAAIAGHPNPAAVKTSLEATRRRLAAQGVARPGDRAAALDHHLRKEQRR
jgi:tetratricopeptide (TPR) repeat protein